MNGKQGNSIMKKAFFLDRDGVIIEQVEYIRDPDEVKLTPGAAEALKLIHRNGFLAVVISNQSGIARGKFTLDELMAVQRRMYDLLAEQGEKIDGFYFCPHDPHVDVCSCRKPKPGMIFQAVRELGIDAGASFMIGDRPADIETGIAGGCRDGAMVLTGYGEGTAEVARERGYRVAPTLLDAVKLLLATARNCK